MKKVKKNGKEKLKIYLKRKRQKKIENGQKRVEK